MSWQGWRLLALATPAFVLLENGRIERIALGAQSEARIERMLHGR